MTGISVAVCDQFCDGFSSDDNVGTQDVFPSCFCLSLDRFDCTGAHGSRGLAVNGIHDFGYSSLVIGTFLTPPCPDWCVIASASIWGRQVTSGSLSCPCNPSRGLCDASIPGASPSCICRSCWGLTSSACANKFCRGLTDNIASPCSCKSGGGSVPTCICSFCWGSDIVSCCSCKSSGDSNPTCICSLCRGTDIVSCCTCKSSGDSNPTCICSLCRGLCCVTTDVSSIT